MTEETKATGRPRQVTMAGWVAMVGSAFLVLGLYESIAGLRSLDNRELVTDILKSPPYSGLGVSVEEWLGFSQIVYTVAGACAAVAGICGFYALQRSKGARLGLSLAAIPLFLSGFIPGGPFTSALVAVSAVLLWTGPARDWFAGRPVREPARRVPAIPKQESNSPAAPPVPPPVPPLPLPPTGDGSSHVPATSQAPAPYAGFGTPRPAQTTAPLATRPGALVAACVITWVCALLVAGVMTLMVIGLALDPSVIDQAMKRQPRMTELGYTPDQWRRGAFVFSTICIVWSIAAAVLALLVILRVRWARPLLIASAVMAGLLSFASVQAVIPIVTAVAGMVTAYLLLRPEVSRWLNRA